jgi:hypothetical protein
MSVSSKAVVRGVIFAAIGGGALLVGHDYPVGTATNMGPGYFPDLISLLLIGFGLANVALAFRDGDTAGPVAALFPAIMITAGIVCFGLLIERGGLIPAFVALVIFSVLASKRLHVLEFLGMLVVLGVIASLLFTFGLGMPYSYLFWH